MPAISIDTDIASTGASAGLFLLFDEVSAAAGAAFSAAGDSSSIDEVA